jgi:hypothetical protein
VTRYPVATVLAAITLLESSGLVVDVYGRLRPVGPLASRPATEMAPKREASP